MSVIVQDFGCCKPAGGQTASENIICISTGKHGQHFIHLQCKMFRRESCNTVTIYRVWRDLQLGRTRAHGREFLFGQSRRDEAKRGTDAGLHWLGAYLRRNGDTVSRGGGFYPLPRPSPPLLALIAHRNRADWRCWCACRYSVVLKVGGRRGVSCGSSSALFVACTQ